MGVWFPEAIRILGHVSAQYPSQYKSGVVMHSADGYRHIMEDIIRTPGEPSWAFSIYFDGVTAQHYPIRASTWHAGNYTANVTRVSIEFEGRGYVGTNQLMHPLTEPQIKAAIRLLTWLRDQFDWGVLEEGRNLNDHNDFVATTCPDGRLTRYVWNTILEGVNEDMSNADEILDILEQWEDEDQEDQAYANVVNLFAAASALAKARISLPTKLKNQLKYILGN